LATIYDIGELAEVSVATVSAVINNTSYVSPKLRKRVEEAIRELGYSPNLLARGLATKKTQTLGVLIPDIANFFFPEVVRGIEDRVKKDGYTIILGNSDDQLDKEELYLRLFLSKRVDGIVLTKCPGNISPQLLQLLNKNVPPVILLDQEYSELKTDSVLADDEGGGYIGTKHLLELGHRRIGMICGAPSLSTSIGRLAGYRRALAEFHTEFDPSLVVDGDYHIEPAYTAGLELLKRKPTAVFVTNFMMTIGFLRALAERKLSTPKDISIVSYDDFIWADAFNPPLTSVAQPQYELGYKAADVLLSRISKKHKRPQHVVLENSLHIRATTARRNKS
jgi:LacI family transcriptional regulator